MKKHIKDHYIIAFKEFSGIYEDLHHDLAEDFDKEKRQVQKQELINRLYNFCQPHKKDPKKLVNIKKLCLKRMDEYLICLDFAGIPCDNSKAELKLRCFIIKRKISFENRSKKGARAFEINTSVLMIHWKKSQGNFFAQLAQISQMPERGL